jgi:hypothetical protein
MTTPHLLFLTNPRNSAAEEDRVLMQNLSHHFSITPATVDEALAAYDKHDVVVIRNTWLGADEVPATVAGEEALMGGYRDAKMAMRRTFAAQGVKLYNPNESKADMWGKRGYISQLFQAGYPVIPTYLNAHDVPEAWRDSTFLVKDDLGFNSMGHKRLTFDALLQEPISTQIIQPFLTYRREISFYFCDDDYLYATASALRGIEPMCQAWPTPEQIAVAQRFADWNSLPHSLQRVDCLEMDDGTLLMLEIEDDSQRLYLHVLDEPTRQMAYDAIAASLLAYADVRMRRAA